MATSCPIRCRQRDFLSEKWDSSCWSPACFLYKCGYPLHPSLPLLAFAVTQFEMDHLPWNEMRPRAAFLPRRFSAMHSYVPASSCWKLGISRTAFEFFILTLLGNGTPLVLLQLISGTGLQERNKKFPGFLLSVAVIKVQLSTEGKQLKQKPRELLFPTNQAVIAQISDALQRTLIPVPLSCHTEVPALLWIDESGNE